MTGIGGNVDGFDLMTNGWMQATIYQSPVIDGTLSVDTMLRILAGETDRPRYCPSIPRSSPRTSCPSSSRPTSDPNARQFRTATRPLLAGIYPEGESAPSSRLTRPPSSTFPLDRLLAREVVHPCSSDLAVITGSSKGIGEACARRFLAEGVTVVGISTSPPDEPLLSHAGFHPVVGNVADPRRLAAHW